MFMWYMLYTELNGSGSSLGYRSMARRLLSRHGLNVSRFSRRVLWLNVAHTNNNPSVVGCYFMKFVDEIKGTIFMTGVPRCIRIDAGTENVLIEDIQKAFRWGDSDDMASEHSVICGSSHFNQRIERWWLSNRQGGCQFWIDLFKDLEMAGLISTGNALQVECARFCFMELLQEELNCVRMEWNQHHVRFNKASDVPSGKPDLMYYLPNIYSTVDYKIPKEDVDIHAVKLYCESNVDLPDYQHIINVMNRGAFNKPKTVDEALRLYAHLVGHFQ